MGRRRTGGGRGAGRSLFSRKNPDYIRQGFDVSDALKGLSRLQGVVYTKALRAGRQAAVRVALKEAKTNTQVAKNKTGNLRAGLKVKSAKTRATLESHAPHSYVVERGHGGPQPAPPHPFLETAITATRERQLAATSAAIDKWVKKAQTP